MRTAQETAKYGYCIIKSQHNPQRERRECKNIASLRMDGYCRESGASHG